MPGRSAEKDGVVKVVVDISSSNIGFEVYQREEGEETMNTMQNRCMTMHDMAIISALCDLTQY